jgi:hypothetical protein
MTLRSYEQSLITIQEGEVEVNKHWKKMKTSWKAVYTVYVDQWEDDMYRE